MHIYLLIVRYMISYIPGVQQWSWCWWCPNGTPEQGVELILWSEVGIAPWSEGRDHMSSHIDQCSKTSVATSSCGLPIPGSSTNLRVWLLWCCGVGTQSGVRAPDFPECRSFLRNGVDHLIWTTLLRIPILSGLSVVLPLPLLPTPPSLHVRTLSECLGVIAPLLQQL